MNEFLVYFYDGLILIVLIVAVVVIVKSMISLFGSIHYSLFDRVLAMIFFIMVMIQLLVEVIMFVNSGFGYKDEGYSAIEHLLLTGVAAGAVGLGRTISRRSGDDQVKFRFRTIFYSIATLLLFINYILG